MCDVFWRPSLSHRMNILVLEVNLKAKSPIFSFLFSSSPPLPLFLSLFRILGNNQCCRQPPPTPSLPSSPSTTSTTTPSLFSTTSFPNSPLTASPPAGSTVRVPPMSSSSASSQPPLAPSSASSFSPPFPCFFPKPSSFDLLSGLFFSPPPPFPASVLYCSRIHSHSLFSIAVSSVGVDSGYLIDKIESRVTLYVLKIISSYNGTYGQYDDCLAGYNSLLLMKAALQFTKNIKPKMLLSF